MADLTATVTWTSSAVGTAAVSNAMGTQGTVTALAAGTATIRATLGTFAGTATVTVSPTTLTAITVTPSMSVVGIAGAVMLHATGRFSDGTTRDVTSQATWPVRPQRSPRCLTQWAPRG